MKDLRRFFAQIALFLALAALVVFPNTGFSQHETKDKPKEATEHVTDSTHTNIGHDEHADTTHTHACHYHGEVMEEEYDATSSAFHHISDANVYSIGSFNFPLPCILYAKGQGLDVFSSKKFDFDFYGHGEGRKAYNRYVLDEGMVKRVQDESFPMGEVNLDGYIHENTMENGKKKFNSYACYEGKHFKLDPQSTADGGLFGGGITSFYDFSITKNVITMILMFVLLSWAFFSIAKAYKNRSGMAPKGLQSFFEPIFLFIQDEVAKPFLGPKW